MGKEYRVSVYADKDRSEMVARVLYNSELDYYNGNDFQNGGAGRHLGITKLRSGEYVLIYGTSWQDENDYGVIVSDEEALQEILRSQHLELLKTKKFKGLKELYTNSFTSEMEEDDVSEQHRVNVYANNYSKDVVARVRYNADLDNWDGSNWSNGDIGRHSGITKLKSGEYVLIYGTSWQGEKDYGVIVSAEDALRAILSSKHLELLETKKFKGLKELYAKNLTSKADEVLKHSKEEMRKKE